jgi:hypothetical protein
LLSRITVERKIDIAKEQSLLVSSSQKIGYKRGCFALFIKNWGYDGEAVV